MQNKETAKCVNCVYSKIIMFVKDKIICLHSENLESKTQVTIKSINDNCKKFVKMC